MIIEISVAAVVGTGLFVFGILFGRANPKKTEAAVAEAKKLAEDVKKAFEEIKALIKK